MIYNINNIYCNMNILFFYFFFLIIFIFNF